MYIGLVAGLGCFRGVHIRSRLASMLGIIVFEASVSQLSFRSGLVKSIMRIVRFLLSSLAFLAFFFLFSFFS